MGWKYKSAMYVEVTTALEPAAVGKKGEEALTHKLDTRMDV